jgi:hypothetical protein
MSDDPTPPPTIEDGDPDEIDRYTPFWQRPDLDAEPEAVERWASMTYALMDDRLKAWIADRLAPAREADAPDTIPRLTAKSKPRYVAAVARAVASGAISPNAARALLYAAQLVK